MIRRKMVGGVAPSEAAASSISRSSSSRTGCTDLTTNGSVTSSRATHTPVLVKAMLTPTGLSGPYMASRTTPATIVGRAKGRSISEFTTVRPKKRSRTSTHAMIVPITALMATTTSDTPTVSFRAVRARSLVIAFQNPSHPLSNAPLIRAANGIRTMRLM